MLVSVALDLPNMKNIINLLPLHDKLNVC